MQRVAQRNVDIDRQSLRGFLHLVETEHPDELLRVRAPVDLAFEPTALVFELDGAGKSPVIVFENAGGQGMPLVTNVAGNRKLLAACLGVEPGSLPTAFRERCQKYIPCETVARGAWEDVVAKDKSWDAAAWDAKYWGSASWDANDSSGKGCSAPTRSPSASASTWTESATTASRSGRC